MKTNLKFKAIALRKKAFTYSEILEQIPVAKSTLSSWLRSVGLSKKEEQRLSSKKRAAGLRGGAARKHQRIELTARIIKEASAQIDTLSPRESWLIGTALYWAEGSKEKAYKPGNSITFNNSDPRMVRFFLKWLQNALKIPQRDIVLELYLHTSASKRVSEIQKFWSTATEFPLSRLQKIYFKKHSKSTNRKNINNLYCGVLRVKVRASSTYVRQIAGWVEGISQNWEIV